MKQAATHFFAGVRGDFYLLVNLLQNVLRVATYDKQRGTWTWTGENVRVYCLGDFLERFEPETTQRVKQECALQDEVKIVDCFATLLDQSRGAFEVVIGNHDLSSLLQRPRPALGHTQDRRRRERILGPKLRRLAPRFRVVVQMEDIFAAHGGFEAAWFQRHRFNDLDAVNRYWTHHVRRKNWRRLAIFEEKDSPLASRKITRDFLAWQREDEPLMQDWLGHSSQFPRHVTGHEFQPLNASPVAPDSLIEARADFDGYLCVFYVNAHMSDAYTSDTDATEPFLRRPQALTFTSTFDRHFHLLFHDVSVTSMTRDMYVLFENYYQPTLQ